MTPAELAQVISRMFSLEADITPSATYDDPPLHITHSDGTRVDTAYLDNIPNVVFDLPEFTGNPTELASWISDGDSLVKIFQTDSNAPLEQQNRFYTVCRIIRRRIRGEANDCLTVANVGINWLHIKRTLVTYFRQKYLIMHPNGRPRGSRVGYNSKQQAPPQNDGLPHRQQQFYRAAYDRE